MSKVGIDFVIGAKNLAGTAFEAVITSLGAASKASLDFSKSFATISRGVTQSIGNLTTAAGTFASTMAQGVSRSLGTLAQSAARSISTIAQGFAKARAIANQGNAKSDAALAQSAAKANAIAAQGEARTAKILASIKPQMASVQKTLKQVETGMGRLEKASKSLMSTLAPLLAIVAVVKTAMAAVGGVNAAKEAFDAQTESVKRLNSALNIRGAGAATAQMQAFGKQMEAVTGISATAVNQLQAQAIAMGIATDRVDDATKASLGLAEATGKTAEASLGDLTAALQGNFAAFEGVNPQIKFMATNQQKLNAVLDIANQGLTMHGNSLNTVEGSGRRANTAMQNFLEVVGKILEPVRILVNTGLQQLWSSLQTLVMPAVKKAGEMMQNLGPIMDKVRRVIINAINLIVKGFTFLEVIVLNLSDVWDMMKTAAELALVNVSETVKYYFNEVIPQYAQWFGENFPKMIGDAFSAVLTVIKNGGEIAAQMVMDVLRWIADGGPGGTEWLMTKLGVSAGKSLFDGFKSSVGDLPDVVGRQLTAKEQDLIDKMKGLGGKLGDEFSAKLKERLLNVGDTLNAEMTDSVKNMSLLARPQAVMQGSQATEGRLLTRGPASNFPMQMLEQLKSIRTSSKATEIESGKVREEVEKNKEATNQVAANTTGTLQLVMTT